MSDSTSKKPKATKRSTERSGKDEQSASTFIPENTWDSFMKDAVVFGDNSTSIKNVNNAISEVVISKKESAQDNELETIVDGLIKKYINDGDCVKVLNEFKRCLNCTTKMLERCFGEFYDLNVDLVNHAVRQMEKREWRGLMDFMCFEDVMSFGVKNSLMKECVFIGEKSYFMERLDQLHPDSDIKALDQMNEGCMALKDGYLKELFDDSELFGRDGVMVIMAKTMGKAAFVEKTRSWVDRMNQRPSINGPMTPQLQKQLAEFHRCQPRIMAFQGQYLSLVSAM